MVSDHDVWDSADAARRIAAARIMIVEDEAVVAMDLMDIVEDADGKAVGPFATVSASLAALEETTPCAAILDMRLRDGDSYPVAEKLCEAGVPFVFMSGHAKSSVLAERFPDAPFLVKPASQDAIIAALGAALNGQLENAD